MSADTADIEARLRAELPRLADTLTADEPTALLRAPQRRPRRNIAVAVAAALLVVAGAVGIVVAAGRHDGGPTRVVMQPPDLLDHWSRLASSPLSPREGSTSVWTGSEWLVLGGRQSLLAMDDSAAYDPVSDTWRRLAVNPSMHPGAQAVWTGTVAVVLAKGGGWTFDPTADRWTDLPRQPETADRTVQGSAGVWTGHEVVVVGYTAGQTVALSARSLDPTTASWGPASIATGSASPSVAGIAGIAGIRWDGSVVQAWLMDGTGWAYDPADGRWSALPKLVVPGRNAETTIAIAGSGATTYAVASTGGASGSTTQLAAFEGGSWRLVGAPRPGPAGNAGPQLVMAGGVPVLFSSQQGPVALDATDGTVQPFGTPLVGPGSGRALTWTGTELLVWGGRDTTAGTDGELTAAGARVT